MKSSTVIADTPKGARIFLEGVSSVILRNTYDVHYSDSLIVIRFIPEGKRTVVASKGGVIDLQSKKVTVWAQGATVAHIRHTEDTIFISRG